MKTKKFWSARKRISSTKRVVNCCFIGKVLTQVIKENLGNKLGGKGGRDGKG